MFRKKQKKPPANPARNVYQSGRAPVFSYYASRSPVETPRVRGDMNPPKRALSLKHLAGYIPSFVAGATLLVCLSYMSTLTTDANIQIVGSTPDKTLVQELPAYRDEIQAVLEDSVLNRSKLLIDTDSIANRLSVRFPELGEVSVVLPLVGRRPVVKIQPAEPAITLSADGGPYVVDSKGRVLAYTRDIGQQEADSVSHLPIVIDESGLPVERGKVVLTESTITFVKNISGQLSNANVPIESLVLPQANAGELHVKVQSKPYFVKFDMRGEGRLQAGVFLAVKEHLERSGKQPAEYIDVRVPEKAFYR